MKQNKQKFVYLFIYLCLYLIAFPLLAETEWTNPILSILTALIPIVSVYTGSNKKSDLLIILFLSIPALILDLLADYCIPIILIFSCLVLSIISYVYAIYIIVKHVIEEENVTKDTIFGSISIYIILGILWGIIYILLYACDMITINIAKGGIIGEDLLYYSFVTLITIGYGEMTPGNGLAKFLSVFEALAGQLYLTVLVGVLIGKYIAHHQERMKN